MTHPISLFRMFLIVCLSTISAHATILNESRFVMINGIEQWITIRGDSSKPILLVLHGGPGSVMSPFSEKLYAMWEKEFIIVQWDQRGAGRTFGRTAPPELTEEFFQSNPLTVDQFVSDGIAVTEYLLKHLSKRKVILFGSSWGSILGLKMVSQRPELFYAYVGHSQVINADGNWYTSYEAVQKQALMANDTTSILKLKEIGPPPFERAKTVGAFLRILKKYERAAETPAPKNYFGIASEYDNPKDEADRENGDDYSFLNFVGDRKMGIASMSSTVHFDKDVLKFSVPIYLIQGKHDLLTSEASTTAYFDRISAPKKEYYLLQSAAHGFNDEVVRTKLEICRKIAREIGGN